MVKIAVESNQNRTYLDIGYYAVSLGACLRLRRFLDVAMQGAVVHKTEVECGVSGYAAE